MSDEYREALVELAIAVEYVGEGEERFRRALDRAWELVDPDGSIQRRYRLEAGCVECGGSLEPYEDGEVPDLCVRCAGDA